MIVNLDDITASGLKLDFARDADVLAPALQDLSVPPGTVIDPKVQGSILLQRSGAGILVTGSVQARLTVQCSRCLTDVPLIKDIALDLTIKRPSAGKNGPDAMFGMGEDEIPVEESTFDVAKLIVQELLLEAPMTTVCSEDCPGLCPQCGTLRGSPECTCDAGRPVDPRWASLAELKTRTDQ